MTEDEQEKVDFEIFRIFHNLKQTNSKLMTQEELSEALSEFEPPHPSAQVTIDQNEFHINDYKRKKSSIATYIAFTEKVKMSCDGPISVHIHKHKLRLHEVLQLIKGKEYKPIDEIDFYEFKRIVEFLQVKQETIFKVSRRLEDEICNYLFKCCSLSKFCRERNLRSEFKKYFENLKLIDKDFDQQNNNSSPNGNSELNKQDYENLQFSESQNDKPLNRYPQIQQEKGMMACKKKVKRTILPIISIFSAVKLLVNTYYISLEVDEHMLQLGEDWLNSYYKIAFFIQFLSLTQYFTINYSLVIHLMQISNEFNPEQFQHYSLPQKIWKIISITFIGYVSQALIIVIVSIAAIFSLILQVLGLQCSIFDAQAKKIDKWSDSVLKELYGLTKQSNEGRIFQRQMIFLFMRDFVTLTLSALIYFDVIKCPLLKTSNAQFWLIFNTLMAFISSITMIKELFVQSICYNEPMVKLTLLSMKAMLSHYPYQTQIQSQTLNHSIFFANIEGKIPDILGTLKQIAYQFSDQTLFSLCNDLKLWTSTGSWFKQLYTIDLSGSLDFVSIDVFLYFYNEIVLIPRSQNIEMPVQIVVNLDNQTITKMVDNSIEDKIWTKQKNGKYRAITSSGDSLLKICIDSEPKDQNKDWKLEFSMLQLLNKGFDPNDYIDSQNSLTVIQYAQQQKKNRSIKALIDNGSDQEFGLLMFKNELENIQHQSRSQMIIQNKDKQTSKIVREKVRVDKKARSYIVSLILAIKELNSTFDFLSDNYVLFQLFKSEHTAWFTLTLFMMFLAYQICYVPFINMLLNRDSLRFSQKQTLYDKGLAVTMVTPLVLMYLISLDICFIVTTLASFLLLSIFQASCGRLGQYDFDEKIDSMFAFIFTMTLNDVEGMRALKNLAQLFFESIPQVALQIRILFWLQNNTQSLLYKNINIDALTISILSGILHTLLEFATLIIESKACDNSFLEYIIISLNGRFDWIPFQNKLIAKQNSDQPKRSRNIKKVKKVNTLKKINKVDENYFNNDELNPLVLNQPSQDFEYIDFEFIGIKFCRQQFQIRFQLYDSTLSIISQNFSLMPSMDKGDTRFNICFAMAIETKRVSLKKLIEFMVAARGKVNLQQDGLDQKILEIVNKEPETQKMLQSELIPEDQAHPMIAMAENDYYQIVELLAQKCQASTKVRKLQGHTLIDIAFELQSSDLVRTLIRISDSEQHSQITEKLDKDKQEFVNEVINGIVRNELDIETTYIGLNMHSKQQIAFAKAIQANDSLELVNFMISKKHQQINKNLIKCFEYCNQIFNQRVAHLIYAKERNDLFFKNMEAHSGSKFENSLAKQLLKESQFVVNQTMILLDKNNCMQTIQIFLKNCFQDQLYEMAASCLDQKIKKNDKIEQIIEDNLSQMILSIKNKNALFQMNKHLYELQLNSKLNDVKFVDHLITLSKFKAFEGLNNILELNQDDKIVLKEQAFQAIDFLLKNIPKIFYIRDFDNKRIMQFSNGSYLRESSIKYPQEVNIKFGFQLIMNHKKHLLYLIGGHDNMHNVTQIEPEHGYETQSLQVMIQGRYLHSACLLGHDKIVVTGGRGNKMQILNCCELYSIRKNTWTMLPELNKMRFKHSSCSFQSQFVYVFGGLKDNKSYSLTIEKLELSNPQTEWMTVPVQGRMFSRRINPQTIQFSEQEILILGGYKDRNLKDIYLLNVTNNNTITMQKAQSIEPIQHFNSSQPFLTNALQTLIMFSDNGIILSMNKEFQMQKYDVIKENEL